MSSITPEIPELLTSHRPYVSSYDHMGLALFMAIVLHATIVFGISFSAQLKAPAPLSLEVTLAQYEEKEAPENADFIAQANQQGSGTEVEKAQITSTEKARLHEPESREAAVNEPEQAPAKPLVKQRNMMTTSAPAEMPSAHPEQAAQPATADGPKKSSLMRNALEIASLEAKLDHQRRIYAKRPRVTRLTAISAKASATAFYMQNWVRKVERVGNLNYPQEARRRALSGKVRVAVLINDTGGIEGVEILESSGMDVLDDAVVRIVRLAAPFGAFTASMREEADQFEIIRTFDFGKRISSF